MPNNNNANEDDWETEPDFVNDVTEKEQRWGSKTVAGSGHQASIDMAALREEVKQADRLAKLKIAPKPSYGYGGKFGVEQDRMDKSAVDWSHVETTEKHTSQKDYAKGFGGKYGVQTDRQDKSAVGWDHKETTEKHSSQKDYSTGFGGKYGVQKDRQDKSALGWDHHEKPEYHPSQVDYAKGFGGKFGVQTDRVDASSVGWNETNKTELHSSQMKVAISKPDGNSLSSIRQRFEQKTTSSTNSSAPSAAQQRVLEERARWEAERKKKEKEQLEEISSTKGATVSLDSNKAVPQSTDDSMKATQLSSSIGDNTKKRDDPPSSNPVTTTAVSNNLSVLSESNRISHEEEVSQRNNANDESHEDYQRNSLGHHQPNTDVVTCSQTPEMFTAIAMYDYVAEFYISSISYRP
uniref:Src substrate cortactin n=1 Tax=Trichobilharzia regenti TaxID=157069 RepID=A0AA85IXM7_TRIRE|nr:unnamed protein product [Trichobilharzia regenti]